jgi:hypothetical protein
MKSNWEVTRERSRYHFDTTVMDSRWDTVIPVRKFANTWAQELQIAIDASHPVTWRTRGRENDPLKRKSQEYDQEEYDLDRIGMARDSILTNLNYNLTPELQKIADSFDLDQVMTRVHVQWPGQVWNLHMDKLEKWMPSNPAQVKRYFIQLTDWQPGHFWSFGNYTWQGWTAGECVTFDWINVPHSTANAGHTPRVTLQITGVEQLHA